MFTQGRNCTWIGYDSFTHCSYNGELVKVPHGASGNIYRDDNVPDFYYKIRLYCGIGCVKIP